jgi:uncharacterized glyoxalase superfamily protein PhnB
MAMKKLTANLVVEDVLGTALFWCDVLEFEFLVGVPEGTQDSVFDLKQRPLAFAMLRAGEVELMLQSVDSMRVDVPGSQATANSSGVVLFIEVDDVEELRQRVDGRAQIFKDLANSFYGMREFCVRDPNGLLVIFAQKLADED